MFRLEIGREAILGQDDRDGAGVIRTESLHLDILNIRSHGERHVAGQRPGRGCPGKNADIFIGFVEQECRMIFAVHPEHGDDGKVGYLLVTAREIEFVRTQTSPGGGAERLNGESLVKI